MTIEEFLAGWQTDPIAAKDAFLLYRDFLNGSGGISLEFNPRPGISYSLRGKKAKAERELMALVDVVDDDPQNRWLSVCFYADMVQDPDGLGDFVPGGLLGEDAMCFNLDENDPKVRDYILARLKEAVK